MVFRDTTEERDAVFGNLQSGYDLDSHIALEESWTAVLKKIDAEFPIEERQKFILDKLRQNYTWEKRKEAKLLEEYPNKKLHEKKEIRSQLNALKELHEETTRQGVNFKKQTHVHAFSLDWIDPISHLQDLEESGVKELFNRRWFMALV